MSVFLLTHVNKRDHIVKRYPLIFSF